jgi:hypothetical protein
LKEREKYQLLVATEEVERQDESSHGKDDVQVLGDLTGEPSVEFLVGVKHETLSLRAFLASGDERRVLVSFEESGNLGVGEKGVHPLEEAGVEDVGLVHDEADLLALATSSTKDGSEILVKVFAGVGIRDLDLEDAEAVHPGDETRECRLRRREIRDREVSRVS